MSEIKLTDQRPRGEKPKKKLPADPVITQMIADFAKKHGVILPAKKEGEQP